MRSLAEAQGWERIGEAEWLVAASAIPGVSPSDIRKSGIPAEAPWSGVRHKDSEELETSLNELAAVYAARPDLRKFCRAEVIRAKDRAKHASKAEMAEWMLVWLGDPAVFAQWVRLRRLRATPDGCSPRVT
ncbi:MAG TPA: hypothetical protein VKB79_04435 [Bryobacteraceae bacterium]|nr:hypothetical protein [Bryobacteraceae bacterium]